MNMQNRERIFQMLESHEALGAGVEGCNAFKDQKTVVAFNKSVDHACRELQAAYFSRFTNTRLQAQANSTLKSLLVHDIPMPGKPGGWAGGIIYATANQCRRACGVPGLLNKECEEFFNVSMGTIYRRAWQIRRLLDL